MSLSLVGGINVEEYIRKCKCCLDDKELKALWDVHDYDGEQEIYGLLLIECFALPWQPSEDDEFICNLCVSRLREAVCFKQEILSTEEILSNEIVVKDEYSPSKDDDTVHRLSQDGYEYSYLEETINDCNDPEGDPITVPSIPPEDEYEQVEYLETEDQATQEKPLVLQLNPEESSQGSWTPEVPSPQSPKRKWPKKKKKSERTKQYKQYTLQDLRRAVEAVRSGEMTCASAAVAYGVPKKTLTVKVNVDGGDGDETKELNNEKHFQLIEEIKAILLHTTAIPFKTKTTRYYCFYCSTEGPTFEDPDDLRKHTRTKHAHERTKIEIYMRPQWLNEIIKLDVDELHCRRCYMLLPDWNHVFVHLAEVHDLEFDHAYSKVIPYALDSDLKCVLCRQNFHNFGHLDSHMNNHYSNYICYECGDTFLSATRLDKHLNVHKVGSYPCDVCDKVFTLDKYRSKHVSLVHNQESTIKCLYCPEKFVGLFQRHVHVTKHHTEKVKVMTCEFCGNCYTWKPYFLAHMRRRHGAEKKHQCKQCDKSFLMKYELKNHMVRHTGERNFLCGLCGESFTRMINLKKHCQMHKEFNTSIDD
ncbi:zinc finger and BTB domain-containing protein 17-like [Vanessa tameamea]|uniref:Zinc finger and BTB domain-containing protein 17-like n=1 Tax=Vanessa tameamea TaxID=334116 RepID=A0A8B8HXI9_VANTA